MLEPLGLWLKGETDCLWIFRLLLNLCFLCYTAVPCHPTAPSNDLLTVVCPEILEKCQMRMCKSVIHTPSVQCRGHRKLLSISRFPKLSIKSSFLFKEQAKSELKTILPEMLTLICQKCKHLYSCEWRKLQKLCNTFWNHWRVTVFDHVHNLCKPLWTLASPPYSSFRYWMLIL